MPTTFRVYASVMLGVVTEIQADSAEEAERLAAELPDTLVGNLGEPPIRGLWVPFDIQSSVQDFTARPWPPLEGHV